MLRFLFYLSVFYGSDFLLQTFTPLEGIYYLFALLESYLLRCPQNR